MLDEIIIEGSVEGIVYHNPENGYSVIDMNYGGSLITAVGIMPSPAAGEKIKLKGIWVNHPTFGKQFKAQSCERTMPKSAEDMLKYLSGGTIKGIGPATALKIVEKFGDKTFEVLENDPEALSTIKGISEEKALDISKRFKDQFAVREVIVALQKYNMTPTECVSAYKALGAKAVERITENPYVLCSDIIGLRFERADEIAGAFPFSVKDLYRHEAGILHILRHNISNGHTCLPRRKIIPPASALLRISEEDCENIIDELVRRKEVTERFHDGKSFLFLPAEYKREKAISDRIKIMKSFPPAGGRASDKYIDDIEKRNNIHFEEKQRLAINTAITKGLLVLTGGPGTGKTTTINGILQIFEKQNLRVLLAAPTGRAAMRMSEVTGKKAKTIHRLLEVEWGEGDRQVFTRNLENPLEADAVIVDETSMVDTFVFSALLDALPLGCRLILVGDCDQLPAVGAGNVLEDIILSGLIPVVSLTEIFRQALSSLIVTNAHKIVRGEYPDLEVSDKDFFFLQRNTVFSSAKTTVELCCERLPKAYNLDPMNDIQIICPSRKGESGTVSLNRSLQEILNPKEKFKESFESGVKLFREGDKVMQIKNNYDILWTKEKETSAGIFNGDIGRIISINHNAGFMKIDFDGRIAKYPFDCVNELELAYAITVHKSQGSEFDTVIMPVASVVPQLSYRNLLYTAVTRAKSRIVLVGSREQIYAMVDNDKTKKRYSFLKYLLLEDDE